MALFNNKLAKFQKPQPPILSRFHLTTGHLSLYVALHCQVCLSAPMHGAYNISGPGVALWACSLKCNVFVFVK